ncbi:MAG: putative lipid II flippase FtsW [Sphingomonadaceae bacterium]
MSARAHPKPTPDLVLLLVTIVLVVLGVEMVYSASFVVAQSEFGDATYFLSKQVVSVLLGAVFMVGAAIIDYHRLERISVPIMVAVVVAMVLVLIPGLGVGNYGATRWLRVGPLPPIQPSEFAKIALIIYMSAWLAKKGNRVRELTYGFIPFALLLVAMTALIMAQPDMGTSFIVVATAGCLFFVAGANLLHFLVAAGGGALGFAYLVVNSGYRSDRLQAFLNPWADPKDTGWHTIQTLIALGSGGITGLGLGASRQKFYYVPNAHTDAIFAIIGEEMGLIGAAGVILLFAVFAWRGFRIAFRAPDPFGRLLATGVTCMILIQAVTNVAVVTNTIPYTGITLPFISFGGSSLLVCMVGVGLLLGVSRHDRRGAPATGGERRENVVKVLSRKPSRPRLAAAGSDLALARTSRSRRGT